MNGEDIEMTQIAPKFEAMVPSELVARAIGLEPEAIIAPPQMVSTGLPFCITVLRDREALDAARLDIDARRDLPASPFLVITPGTTEAGDTYARLLLAPPSPPEDPFIGSATGAMAAYLWHHGLMTKDTFIAEQGHGMGRPGQARVTRVGPADAMTGIRVSGSGFVLMRGQVDLPAAEE